MTFSLSLWGTKHGLSPDSNSSGLGAAIGSLGVGAGKGATPPEEVPMKPGYKPAPFNPKDPYSPESVKARQKYNEQHLYKRTTADRAADLGYTKAIKSNKTDIDSHGQDVYYDGKTYISPDVDGHNVTNGWKMFDRRGRRVGTYDSDLNYLKP